MQVLKNYELGGVWLEYIATVLRGGVEVFDQRENVIESIPLCFTISDFEDRHGILAKSASKHIIDIYTNKMFSREIIPELNSTYGDRFFDNLGTDQIAWAVDRLKANPWAKSCFIPLVVPNDPGPRIPCLSAVQLAVREDALNFYATFRSQNAFNSYGNFIGLRKLQLFVSERLGVESGPIAFFVNFPHIYLSDIDQCKLVLETNGLAI